MRRQYTKMLILPVKMDIRDSILSGSVMNDKPMETNDIDVEPYDDENPFVISFDWI